MACGRTSEDYLTLVRDHNRLDRRKYTLSRRAIQGWIHYLLRVSTGGSVNVVMNRIDPK